MWFKNIALFRFSEPFSLDEAGLEERLAAFCLRPCGSHEPFSLGWVAPLQSGAGQLVHTTSGFMMICCGKEEKVLPVAVVNEMLAKRAQELEEQQARRLRRKERENLRDEIVFELLPKALSFSKRTYAYIDTKGQWLVIDSGSSNSTDEFTGFLRKSLDSLPIAVPNTNERPASVMTRWLNDQRTPADITLEDECELHSTDHESNTVRCKRQDLFTDEIQVHLDAGKECIKLGLSWNDRLTFVLDESLNLKRLRFLDLIQNQAAESHTEDAADIFDTEFSIMTLELANFIPRLLELFGGESTPSDR